VTQFEVVRTVSPQLLTVLNHLCELEQKIAKSADGEGLKRHVARMKDAFQELHLVYDYPLGKPFDETRTDVEAHISGASTDDLRVVEVLKPVIRLSVAGTSRVIQKGVVVVSGRKE
jgi:hypothetical protein